MNTAESSPDRDFLSILDSMSDAFCVVDKNCRLICVNSRAEQITCRKKADLPGDLAWDAFRGSIGSSLYNHYHLKSDEGSTRETGLFCSRLDAWIEISTMPSPLGLAIYFRDVLVSDIGPPDDSGHDLVRQAKSVQHLPAVALSGFGSASDIQNRTE